MKIAIRDDDLCAWSDYMSFRKVYDYLDVPVSIALVPYAVCRHGIHIPYGINESGYKLVEENKELCKGLASDAEGGKCEIMLHGITHEYKFINGNYVPEMVWFNKKQLSTLIPKYKLYFEEIFNVRIETFISPGNKDKKPLFKILKRNHLNYNGLIYHIYDRPFSLSTLVNFFKRWHSRLKYGYSYNGILKYRGWSEIQSFTKIEFNYLLEQYKVLKSKKFDMVISTHYWELNGAKLEELKKFIDYIRKNDNETKFVLMRDIFNSN